MSAHVISHRRPRRKRGGWQGFALRRLGALAVTLAGLYTASLLAPYLEEAPPIPPAEHRRVYPVLPPALPQLTDVDVRLDLAGGPLPAPVRRAARRGVPLNADPGRMAEDFEILSASELDGISQARN